MSDNFQSIEGLIHASQGGNVDEESGAGKFLKKQEAIKRGSVERQSQVRATSLGVPYIDLFGFPISPEAIVLISRELASQVKTICFFYDGSQIRLASTNPEIEEVQALAANLLSKHHAQVQVYLISDQSFDYALAVYDKLPKVREVHKGVNIEASDLDKFKDELKDYRALNDRLALIGLSDAVALILAAGVNTGASDIHIEAEVSEVIVRLRIDGVLQDAATMAYDRWRYILPRLKMLAGVKINIADKPQDGRFTIFFPNEKLAVRCSFLPTAYGESVVMRLLRSSSIKLSLEDLGFSIHGYEILGAEISKPNGMILTTGPTGSGKTTTLYAVLNTLNKPGVKIITLEDPIEYQLDGVNQSQVNSGRDYTFANGLRSILRQDPDIVMVGEIRDGETADIAVQASLTGHLVLSTLHTNDASGAIPRLVELGVKPYFVNPAINAVIGQRLARRLCDKCKVEHRLIEKEKEQVLKILSVISTKANVGVFDELPVIYKSGGGCEVCSGVGHKGRVGLYEIFTMTPDIKEMVHEGASAFAILEKAIDNGMVTMLQDGVLKILNGVTSLEEVYRVIGKFDYIDAIYAKKNAQ